MNTSTNSYSDKAKYVYITLFFVSLGLLTFSHYLDKNLFWHLLTLELGIAGIVAFILIFTIERLTKEERENATKKQIQSITKNLFHAIYGRYIPDSVFSEVERSLFSCDVVRTNYQINYAISAVSQIPEFPTEEAKEHLMCSITSRYDLKNITDKEIKYDIRSFIELPIDKELWQFVKFSEISIDGTSCDISTENTDSHIVLTQMARIGPKSKISVITKCVTIKRKTDSEVWASIIPSDGIKMTVSSPPHIEVKASENHSTALNYSLINESNIITTEEWSINTGVFPHQSIIFWWKDLE